MPALLLKGELFLYMKINLVPLLTFAYDLSSKSILCWRQEREPSMTLVQAIQEAAAVESPPRHRLVVFLWTLDSLVLESLGFILLSSPSSPCSDPLWTNSS